MADKRISQLVERTDIANNDVVPIVAFGATTTNKATISSIQEFMQENLDLGVTSVGITLGTTGTDVNVTGSPITTSGNITINIPDASATARGVVTTGTQTFAGIKYFNDTIVANDDIQLVQQGTALPTFIKNISGTFLTAIGSNGIGFNGSNNIYFAGSNKNGGVIAFNNTENRIYTLQDASGTLAFTSQLDGYVTLGTAQTITGQKTFSTSGGSDTTIINHGSGSGIALNITKGGNNEALRVNKTSGSGNAMTVIGGNFEAPTIVKTGGTSSQFLKADGSVDSNTYLTTASASAAYVPYTGANANLDLGQFDLLADTIIVNGSSPTSGSYLGFKHATTVTTGAEGYTSMYTFGTNIIGYKSVSGSTNKDFSFDMSSITANVSGGRVYTLPDASGTLALTSNLSAYLPLSGGTLTGALNGTSASFTGDLTIDTNTLFVNSSTNMIGMGTTSPTDFGSGYTGLSIDNVGAGGGVLNLMQGGARKLTIAVDGGNVSFAARTSGEPIIFRTNDGTIAPRLTIASTGAATFSSSVTAGAELLIAAQNFSTTATNNGIRLKDLDVAISNEQVISKIEFETSTSVNPGVTAKIDALSNTFSSSTSNGNLRFFTSTSSADLTERMRITSAGNVGIGTTGAINAASGWTNFVVNGSDRGLIGVKSNEVDFGAMYGSTASNAFVIQAYGTSNAGSMVFLTASTERMRITSLGFTKASNTGLYVFPTGNYHELRTDQVDQWSTIISNSSSSPYVLNIRHSNANPNNSDNWFIYCEDSTTAARFRVASNGNVTNTNGSYGSISDVKLKENITDATPKLDDLLKVKVRNYNLIGEETKQIGVIAQELEEIFPAMVSESEDFEEVDVPQLDEEGNEVLNEEGEVVTTKERVSKGTTTKSVKYSVFVPMLIKAIQELKTEIDSLKNQIK